MDENKNNENKEHEKEEEEIREIKKMIEDFKNEIQDLRQFAKKEEHLAGIEDDATYKVLLETSDLTADDIDLDSLNYPYRKTRKQRAEEEAKRIRAEDLRSPLHHENWKPSEQKIYIREFFAEPEEPVSHPLHRKTPALTQQFDYQRVLEQPRRDFEQLVGENLLNRLGIIMVTLGVFILLRYGINTGAVTEVHRTMIGFATAAAFLALAHQLRQRNETFSTVFIYGGIAIAYYTSYLSFYYYALFTQSASFAVDVLITTLALFFAISYDRRRLALLALVGAYSTPFMVRTGDVNYLLFFSYILMVNIILIVVANYKKWEFINWLIFALSVFLFGGWLGITDLNHERMYTLAFLFATLYYVSFFMMYLMYTLRHGQTSRLLFGANTFLYYMAVWLTLAEIELAAEYMGTFSFMLGAFNGIYAVFLHKNQKVEPNFITALAGFAIFMITLSVYLEFDVLEYNRYWVIEAVVLLLVARFTNMKILRDVSVVIMGLAVFMLLITWYKIYTAGTQSFFFNAAVYTSLITVAGLGLSILLLQKERKDETATVFMFRARTYTSFLGIMIALIIYATGNIELQYHHFTINEFRRLWVGIYNSSIVLLLWGLAFRLANERLKNVCAFLTLFVVTLYFLYGHFSTLELRNEYLAGSIPLSYFSLHYINVLMNLGMSYLMITDIYRRFGENSSQFSYLIWFASFVVIFHLSAELDNLVVLSLYDQGDDVETILHNSHRIGYALLWAATSFGFMLLGMRMKLKDLRMISLTMFGLTLVKFVTYDIWHISTFGKIISMIFVGSLLLVVSFLYNQLRLMVSEGELDTTFLRRPRRETRGPSRPDIEDIDVDEEPKDDQ